MIGLIGNRTRIWVVVLALFALSSGLPSAPVAVAAQDADTKCGKCGAANKGGQKFCGECGAKIETPKPRTARCETCGAQGRPGQKFCGECGGKLVSGEPPRKGGQLFTHPDHAVTVTLPDGWTMRKEQFQFGIAGTILEFQKGNEIFGALAHDPQGRDPAALVHSILQSTQQAADKVEELVQETLPGGGVRLDFRATKGAYAQRYATAAVAQDRKAYYLVLTAPDAQWGANDAAAAQVVRSLGFGGKKAEGAAETDFTHPDHRITMTLPEGWAQRRNQFQFGIQNTLLEFQCGNEVNGALAFDPSGTEPGALLQTIVKGFEQGGSKAQAIGEAALTVGKRMDLRVTHQGKTLRYTVAAVRENQKSYYLVLLMADELWTRYQAQTAGIVGSLRFGEKGADRLPPLDLKTAGRTYTSADHRFQLEVPEGWRRRDGQFRFGIEGSILEFENDQGLKGVLAINTADQPLRNCLQNAVQSIEVKSDKLEVLREVEIRYGGLRTDFKASKGPTTLRYSLAVVPRNPGHYLLLLMAADSAWDKVFLSVDQLLQSWTFEKPPGGEPPVKKEPGTRRNNPWKGFKAGSWSKYEVTSVSGNKQKKMEVTYVLVDPGDDSFFVMRTDLVLDGQEFPGKPTRVDLNQGEPGTVVKESDERVRVPKGEFPCHCVERTEGTARTRIWESPDVPFAIVKRVDETEGTTNTSVLTDFHCAP